MTPARRGRRRIASRVLALLTAIGALSVVTACGQDTRLVPKAALEKYPALTEEVAAAVSDDITPLAADGEPPTIDESSDGCRVSAASYLSEDLLSEDGEVPTAEHVVAVADDVLTDHGFTGLELEDEDPRPMQVFVSTDDTGGSIRAVIESRPGRPTITVWWSAQVDTHGADCDESRLH